MTGTITIEGGYVLAKFSVTDLMNDKTIAGNGEDKVTFKIDFIPLNKLTPSEMNKYNVADVAELKASIELMGLMQNLTVRRAHVTDTYEIISGHRRFKALQELYDDDYAVPCNVVKTADDLEAELRLIFANSTNRELNDYERTYQAGRLKELLTQYEQNGIKVTGRKREVVAELLRVSPAQIGRMESINKNLSADFTEAFRTGEIGITEAYELSTKPEEEQAAEFSKRKEAEAKLLNDIEEGEKQALEDFKNAGSKTNTPPAPEAEESDECEVLKPCPFCGGEAFFDSKKSKGTRSNRYYIVWVYCFKCGIRTIDYDNSEKAMQAWNKRI